MRMSFQCMRHSESGQTTQDRTFEQDGAGAASPELSVFRPPACPSYALRLLAAGVKITKEEAHLGTRVTAT